MHNKTHKVTIVATSILIGIRWFLVILLLLVREYGLKP